MCERKGEIAKFKMLHKLKNVTYITYCHGCWLVTLKIKYYLNQLCDTALLPSSRFRHVTY